MRLFDDDELRRIAMPTADRLRAALAGVVGDDPAELVSGRARSTRRFVAGFEAWAALIGRFVTETQGAHAARRVAADGDVLRAVASSPAAESGVLSDGTAEERAALDALRDGDTDGALAAYGRLEKKLRTLHAVHRDRVTLLLGSVYRTFGVDALEESLRYVGERTLLRWLPTDIGRDPRARLRSWVSMLAGNFAVLDVQEESERFVIIQSPCGTCGRQVADGSYGPRGRFAVVTEPHPVTFDMGDTPIYRTHVAVMHELLPMERIGVPWPVVLCPAGLADAPCRILLYKDPLDRAALRYLSDRRAGRRRAPDRPPP